MVKFLDGVQSTEGRATQPKLIGTFNFNDFTTVSASKFKYFAGALSRNAKARTFILQYSLNQPTTAGPTVFFYDTLTTPAPSNFANGAQIGTVIGVSSTMVDSSERLGLLAAHVDSFSIGIPMGATLPTSGKVDVYVVEYF